MNLKTFGERLNRELDNADFPSDERSRVKAFSKVFSLPPHIARMIIKGQLAPSEQLLMAIAGELEVSRESLLDNVRGVI